MTVSMDSNLPPTDPPPVAPPTDETSDYALGVPPKTIQIFHYRVDVDGRHFSSQSSPGVKFTQYGNCYSTRPHAKSDLDALSQALPYFDCDIREWQQTRHSTLDQTLKLRFPYAPKALWSVVHHATGIYMAAVHCMTPASTLEAELHFNNRAFALTNGRSFLGGLHAVTFCCPTDIEGPAYVVFTFKDQASLVVDQEICIITEGKRDLREPIEVPLAVRNPLDETLTPNMNIKFVTNSNGMVNGQQSGAQQNGTPQDGIQQHQPQQKEKTNSLQIQSPATNPMQTQPQDTPELPMGCSPAKATQLCHVDYMSPDSTHGVDNPTAISQQPQTLQSPTVDVASTNNTVAPAHTTRYESTYLRSNVGKNLVFPTIRYDPSKAILPGNTGSESRPSSTSGVVSPKFGIPHTKLEVQIAVAVDKLLWERRDVDFSELSAKLPPQVVPQWTTINSRWLGRKRVLEKLHAVSDLSTLFKNPEARQRQQQRQPKKRSQKQPSPPRSPRSFPLDLNYPGLCRSNPLTMASPVVAQATVHALPFRPLVPSAPVPEFCATNFPPPLYSLDEPVATVLGQ